MLTTEKSVNRRISRLFEKLSKVRRTTEAICKPLATEDYLPQPMVDVSPPKWHLAHSTWFFETFVLKPFYPGYKVFHPAYNELFNSYYNTIGTRTARNQRGSLSRPTVEEIFAYRKYVNEHLSKLENYITEKNEEEISTLIETGCQHEQQHQELLITDLKYILYCNVIRPVYHTPALPQIQPVKSEFLPVEEGIYQIGYRGSDFCFDNELYPHKVFLHEFRIQNRLVTNGEYMDFIADGGYRDFRLWLSEGWDLVNKEQWQKPLYWQEKEEEWHTFSLLGDTKVDKQAPVSHVSFFEAAAYAAWSGKRLLTEFEWEAAAQKYNPAIKTTNSQDQWIFQPMAATSADGLSCHQLFGEVWQWTNSAYLPYPGFTIAEGALGEYNGKFMMNQMVLRGSSCATPYDHMRATYRNFFPAYTQWQFAGIRLAE